jgi:hypothetical protein
MQGHVKSTKVSPPVVDGAVLAVMDAGGAFSPDGESAETVMNAAVE